MKTYNFLKNVREQIRVKEREKKYKEIGKIVNSLQQPFNTLLRTLQLKQEKDV